MLPSVRPTRSTNRPTEQTCLQGMGRTSSSSTSMEGAIKQIQREQSAQAERAITSSGKRFENGDKMGRCLLGIQSLPSATYIGWAEPCFHLSNGFISFIHCNSYVQFILKMCRKGRYFNIVFRWPEPSLAWHDRFPPLNTLLNRTHM